MAYMENTYWNGKGKFQADYTRLCDALIPASGKCDTVAGELMRSATRLAYDLYNNGMGNNTSGAVNYLHARGAVDCATHRTVHEYTRGRIYEGHYEGDEFQLAVESLVDQTVAFVLANPALEHTPNDEDMFDYSEPDQLFCCECGDELDGRSWGGMCSYCEQETCDEEEDEEYEY